MEHAKNSFQKPDWVCESKMMSKLVSMKSYKCHNESVPTAKAPELDQNHYLLGFSNSGNATLPIKNLTSMVDQARQMMRVLSHADIFSLAAFKCLEQEEMNASVLKRILQSLAISIKHTISFSSALSVELLNARRDAVMSSGRVLSDEAKAALKDVPLNYKTLFGGVIKEVCKKDSEYNKESLIETVSTSGKKQFAMPKPSQQSKKV